MIKGARTECVKKPSGKKLSACEENLNLRKGKETTLGKPGELLRNASPQSIWGKMELVKRNKGTTLLSHALPPSLLSHGATTPK